ncbi:MAG: accessory gene regulator B family protein [Bacillota bacterium]|nr:accessory gene regulator B family protein [Bacillota bacterium]
MFLKQVDRFSDVLIDQEIITIENKDLIVYGLSTGIELILNILTIIALGFVLDMLLESILFVISFAFIRVYAGGYHLKKVLNCYLLSSGIVALALLAVKFTPKEYMILISLLLLVISIPIILKFAPMGTPNKPLGNDEKKYYRKKVLDHMGIELIFIFVLFLLGMRIAILLISLSIFISSFLIVISVYEKIYIHD